MSQAIRNAWLAFYSAFLNIHRSGLLTALFGLLHSWCHVYPLSPRPHNHAPCHVTSCKATDKQSNKTDRKMDANLTTVIIVLSRAYLIFFSRAVMVGNSLLPHSSRFPRFWSAFVSHNTRLRSSRPLFAPLLILSICRAVRERWKAAR